MLNVRIYDILLRIISSIVFAGQCNMPSLACYVKPLLNQAKVEIEAIAFEITQDATQQVSSI